MNPTAALRAAGQSLWLDNITRDLLTSGTLDRYISELSVTGPTSNPAIYGRAIEGSNAYDDQIREGWRSGTSPEDLFFDLALDDLRGTTPYAAFFWNLLPATFGNLIGGGVLVALLFWYAFGGSRAGRSAIEANDLDRRGQPRR